MDPEFFRGVSGHKLFLVTVNFRNFFIYRALSTLNFSEGVSRHQLFFDHAKFEVKNFSAIFFYTALWTLNFLKRVLGH